MKYVRNKRERERERERERGGEKAVNNVLGGDAIN